LPRPTATPRCGRTSRPCRAGNATSGIEGQGWFLAFHVFTRYVKVTFFRGTSLRPVPPGASKHKETRYLDIHEDDALDEAQLTSWVRQAAALPGWLA
jgi:hypothetical protein